jgi:hypothetical protein
VADRASLHVSPDDAAPTLTDVLTGQEVDLLGGYQKWVQVSLPSGGSGWLPQAKLFQTAGRPLW